MKNTSLISKKSLWIKYIPTVMICGVFTLTSCVNDPEHIGSNLGTQTPATQNPMPDLTVPSGFNWSTIRTVNLNVNVNDEYLGEYAYTVDAWDNNPTNNSEAHLLSKGVALKGKSYTTSFSIPAGMNALFIRQTDPKGRSVVRSYPISNTGGEVTIDCDFASTPANKRSGSSRASQNEMNVPGYTKVPEGAIEISDQNLNSVPGNALQNNGVYKITGEYKGTFTHNGVSSAKLFVEGTWTVDQASFQIETGLEIIVLPGAKIKAGNLHLVGSSQLDIMPGASVEMAELQCSNTNKVYNLGSLNAQKLSNNPGLLYNGEKGIMEITNFNPGGSEIYNYGFMKFKQVDSKWGTKWFNNCSVEVENGFIYQEGELTMEQGIVKASKMQFNGNKILMSNGSMLSASEMIEMQSGTTFNGGTGEARSLIQSPKLNFTSGIVFQGMLTVETDDYPKGDAWWKPYNLVSPAEMTGYKQSNLIITTCNGGTGNEGNPGDPPQNPEWPIVINDETTYSYAFEDNWPVYGDYDMNDAVIYITGRELTKQESGAITSYKIYGRLMAVGASKKIAAAMRMNLLPSDAKDVKLSQMGTAGMDRDFFDLNQANLENNQTMMVIPLFSDAHVFLSGNDKREPVNTIVGLPSVQPRDFEIEITFDESKDIKERDLIMEGLDLFIITDGKNSNRQEVHLPNYKPTDRADARLVNTGNCVGSRAPYLSTEGLSFGLMIPSAFRWPNEYTIIRKAYDQFAPWVQSSGDQYQDWYLNFSGSNVYPVIK